MPFSLNIDGRNIANILFHSYNWQNNSRRDPSPETTYPAKNALLRYTAFPTDNIFTKALERAEENIAKIRQKFQNVDFEPMIYNRQSKLIRAAKLISGDVFGAVSIMIGDDGVVYEDSGSEAAGEPRILDKIIGDFRY